MLLQDLTLSDLTLSDLLSEPALYAAQKQSPDEAAYTGILIGFRSPILAEVSPLSKDEIGLLEQFLKTLSSPAVMADRDAVPQSVPSGKNEFLQHQKPVGKLL